MPTKKWTHKAAMDRMKANTELPEIYQRYPLAKILVESAAQTRPYPGYHRISHYYAYKDWMWAATNSVDSKDGWVCIEVIDDLLPPDDSDNPSEEGSCISTPNPKLPGLPDRPTREILTNEQAKFYGLADWREIETQDNKRLKGMRAILESLVKPEDMPASIIQPESKEEVQQDRFKQVKEHLIALQELFGDLAMDLKISEMVFEDMEQLREENEELQTENEHLRKENEELKRSTNQKGELNKLQDVCKRTLQLTYRKRNIHEKETTSNLTPQMREILEMDIKIGERDLNNILLDSTQKQTTDPGINPIKTFLRAVFLDDEHNWCYAIIPTLETIDKARDS